MVVAGTVFEKVAPALKIMNHALASGGLTSCANKQESSSATTSEPAPVTPTITDANIAAIVVAANQVDIEAGQLAKTKSQNAQVKAFADQMINEHSGVNAKATELVTRLNVAPEDNDTSRQLLADGTAKRGQLAVLTGADFDRAYVDNEVAYHEAVLSAMDNTLIPGAQNAELKALITGVRPTFVAHLDHAKQLQSSLSPQ